MRDKYSGLQIGIHWLVFLLVVVAYAADGAARAFPRSERPLINMVHVSCGITIFVLMVARLLVRLKSPAPPIVPKTIADDDRFRPSWSPGDLFAVHCLAVDRHGDDVLAR